MASFKDRLEMGLVMREITPAELSKMTGIGEGAISQYRKGAYKASQRNLEKIATALQVSIPWLMGVCDETTARKSSIYENIKKLREKLGWSQEELAERVGYTDRSSIAKIEAGKVDLQQSKIAAFAAALSVSPAQLMGIDNTFPSNITPLPKMREWPVLGATACGTPLHREMLDETVLAPDDIKADVVFRCIGDSMINARIFDGDAVFIRLQPEVENGQIAVVRIEDEYTLKRVYVWEDYVELRAENPKFSATILRGAELAAGRFEIVGLAVAFLSTVS